MGFSRLAWSASSENVTKTRESTPQSQNRWRTRLVQSELTYRRSYKRHNPIGARIFAGAQVADVTNSGPMPSGEPLYGH